MRKNQRKKKVIGSNELLQEVIAQDISAIFLNEKEFADHIT